MDGTDFTNWLIVIIATAYKNFISLEGSLLPLWKFRYVEGGEEEEEGDGTGKKEPLEITSLRWPLCPMIYILIEVVIYYQLIWNSNCKL